MTAPRTARATEWVYEGIWAGLVQWFRVPKEPPTLPVRGGERIDSFRPAEGFLLYLKFVFWILLLLVDLAILVVWIIIAVNKPLIGMVLLPLALVIAIVPDIIAYIALHLRYDTTWYVMTDRSMRIRRGIWVIHETTITFENIQNVKVVQGPLQRHYGIANVVVETAGAGGGQGKQQTAVANVGIIEGVSNASELRDRILAHMRESKSAGLGDEDETARADRRGQAWTTAHLEALRAVRDEVRALARAG